MLHENTKQFRGISVKELEATKQSLRRSQEVVAGYYRENTVLKTLAENHQEVYDRLENRAKSAEATTKQLRQQQDSTAEVFKAAVAGHTAQSRRLHEFLAQADVAEDSESARLRRRNADLREQVKRLTLANRTLRARVKLEAMDPDVLTLVVEGSFPLDVSSLVYRD